MTKEILDKLQAFLKLHAPITEECHAVYLLVEIRKLLDREKASAYPLLRFYADWSVHTEKDRITRQINVTMDDIYYGIMDSLAKGNLRSDVILGPFISMQQLQGEVQRFLKEYGLPLDLVKKHWPNFQILLAGILVDQPINHPCSGIQRFSFKRGAKGAVGGEVIYRKSTTEYDRLALGCD